MENYFKTLRLALKSLLRGYTHITSSICRKLKKLGFILVEGRKHYRVYFGDNMRCHCILAKTPSDFKAGINAVAGLMAMVKSQFAAV